MSTDLSFNIFNLFIVSASIHGLIFGLIVLFSKKFNAKPNRFLAFYVLLVSLNNIYFWFFDTNIVSYLNWKHFWLFPIQWDLLMFPVFYYFISTYLGNKKLPKFYMYPFYISLPFCLIFLFQQIFFSELISQNFVTKFYIILSYVSIIFTAIAIYNGFKLISNYQKQTVVSNQPKINVIWLKKLLSLAVVVFGIWVLITIFNTLIYRNDGIERVTTYVLWISMSLLIYWMGYLGVYHLGIFNQRADLRKVLIPTNIGTQNNEPKSKKRFEDINAIIKAEKLYLNPSLSLQALADRFELSEGYLSQLVNSNANSNFSDYVNALRIEDAKAILINPSYKNYTIISIALESGFNSKSTFYTAFKKHVGISPIAFKKQHNIS